MAPSQRDRISVDLGGLRAALFEQARTRGASPSSVVRAALAAALAQTKLPAAGVTGAARRAAAGNRVRVSLRLTRRQAVDLMAAADLAGMPLGDFIAGLVDGIPALAAGAGRKDMLAGLTHSTAAMSTLSRNLRHLSNLLREGEVRAAQEYRKTLDTVANDVHSHIALASAAMTELQPRRRS